MPRRKRASATRGTMSTSDAPEAATQDRETHEAQTLAADPEAELAQENIPTPAEVAPAAEADLPEQVQVAQPDDPTHDADEVEPEDILEPDEAVIGTDVKDDGTLVVVTSSGRKLRISPEGDVQLTVGQPGPVLRRFLGLPEPQALTD